MYSHEDVIRALAQSPFFVCLIDRDGRLAFSSAFAYGLSPPDLIGRPADEAVVPEDRPAWWDAFLRARDGREVVRYAISVRVPEVPGRVRLAGRAAPVVGADGRVEAVVTVCFDVSHGPHETCVGCRQASAPTIAPAPPPRGYSPLEAKILAGLAGKGWVVTADLAEAIGEDVSNDLRAVLRNLEALGAVELHQRQGVRLSGRTGG